ncbi:MarR family winged helix-turn-helix transcriptional regulator [Shewanella loihica]|uniref:Transcriptional regulator, MarR family n=2 Tax=Shewanella TaxID=22 RepID=A3QB23_SHELP|nr:transcriptional regulator, MarR family [Shewanella loihica PV-4]
MMAIQFMSQSTSQDIQPNPLALENQVCFSLYSAANAMVRAYRPLLEALDLTYSQYLAMLVLWQEPGISVKTLGEQLHLDSGTLTPLLKRLESKGLVTRGRSEADERVRVLQLTDAGRELQQQARSIPMQMRCKLGGEPEEFAELKRLCDKAYRYLDAASQG